MIGTKNLAGRIRLALVLLAIGPSVMVAQSAADRVAIFQFRDSLARVADTTSLLLLESRVIDSARKNREDPVLHIRLGFVGLRLAQLTSGPVHFRDSEGEFEWATQLQPTWPLAWYGLGTAELLEADVVPAALRGLLAAFGRDVLLAPAHDLAQSAIADSMFSYGLVRVTDEALQSAIPAHLSTALNALRSLSGLPAGRNVQLLLRRGRVEREIGDVDSALAAFQSILDRNAFDGLALFEMGRTKLTAGRVSGADQWFLGLSMADSETAALYRLDLRLVMSDSALRLFDAARGEGRMLVARRFWDTRDADAVNSSMERLREHYRRIAYAHLHYPLSPPDHRYDSVKVFEPTGSLFDDRGRVYVRHGEPDDRASYTMAGLPPNESWLYRRPGGTDLLFHFAQPDSAQGYRIYESLLDIVGLGTAAQQTGQGNVRGMLEDGKALTTYGPGWTAQAAQALIYSRAKLSPVYDKMLKTGQAGAKSLQTAERSTGRKSIQLGLQSDSWRFAYELAMAATVDVVAVGSDGENTQLQVVFAIPGSSLYAPPTNGTVIYPIRTRVTVRNAAGDVVKSVDTLRNFGAAAPVPETGNLLGRLALDVPPGSYTVRVALEGQNRGLITKPQSVRVAPLHAGTIELSDLALGSRTVRLPWRVGPVDTAWINPLRLFRQTEPMQLFFEVGGLAAGSAYHAQWVVMHAGQKDAQLQVGFDAVATGTPDRVHRELDLGRLGAGNYVLQVTVSTANGAKAVRQREFTVVK